MKQFRSELQLFLVSAILIICGGFIFISCGKDPQQKTADSDTGQFALDFASCSPGLCYAGVEKPALHGADRTIAGRELTIEAWVKKDGNTAAANFTGGIMGRFDTDGIVLYVKNGEPKAAIRRTVGTGVATATVDYIVDSNVAVVADLWDNAWHHIAAVLTEDDHSAQHTCTNKTDNYDCVDTPPTGDPVVNCSAGIHLDIYIDGVFQDCNTTYGQAGDPAAVPTLLTAEPFGETVVVGKISDALKYIDPNDSTDPTAVNTNILFPGAIDEARLWREERSLACRNQELGLSGTCSRLNKRDELVAYLRFNEGGNGSDVSEWSGLGGGIKELDGQEWHGGWITGNTNLARTD